LQKFSGVFYAKSGTDFQNISEIEVWEYDDDEYENALQHPESEIEHHQIKTGHPYTFRLPNNKVVIVKKHDVTIADPICPKIEQHVETYNKRLEEQMKKVVSV
jgi:hypothetical protein